MIDRNRIQTFTGKWVNPLSMRPEDVDIRDIAHALSMLCRFGGHSKEFYSVAQHSVSVSNVCISTDALWGLLHDASEAYIVDVPRPIKHATGFGDIYKTAEADVMRVICGVFGLPIVEPESVSEADTRLLVTESRDLLADGSVNVVGPAPLPHKILCMRPENAEALFLRRFAELRGSNG